MDKFHIYEEIGRGAQSQVFKGREKKTIEYVAIKRVDKARMSKIVHEVHILHRLSSPHVMRFIDWYETRNNLWLILEYCTGGDLCTLLKQEGSLPETSIQMFGADVLAATQHIHSHGFLLCDFRPENILIDEFGILKVADFGNARKIPKQLLGATPLEQRGYILHMAPELFLDCGAHSYASDFWGLGCLLFLMKTGRPPFEAELRDKDGGDDDDTSTHVNLDSFAPTVQSADHWNSASKATVSPALADLLNFLLEKRPIDRPNWAELLDHPFWTQTACPVRALPPQPVWQDMVNQLEERQLLKPLWLPSDAVLACLHEMSTPGPSTTAEEKSALLPRTPTSLELLQPTGPTAQETPAKSDTFESHTTHDRTNGTKSASKRSDVTQLLLTDRVEEPPDATMQLLLHPSDLQIKPIMGNKTIEVIEPMRVNAQALPFTPVAAKHICNFEQPRIEEHLTAVYRAMLNQHNKAIDRNIIAYLCSIVASPEVANVVINSRLMTALLRAVKRSRTPSTKVAITTLVAGCIRHATYIHPDGSGKDEDLIPSLDALLQDPDSTTRRRALAALGEMLFYIAAQNKAADANPSSGLKWALPPLYVRNVLAVLHDKGDPVLVHYAAKTIENIMIQAGSTYGHLFSGKDTVVRLLQLACESDRGHAQATCASALMHILRHSTISESDPVVARVEYLALVFDPGNCRQVFDAIKDGNSRVQQPLLTIVNLLFVASAYRVADDSNTPARDSLQTLKAARGFFVRTPVVGTTLVAFVEHGGTASVKAKSLLLLQNLSRYYPPIMKQLSERRLPSHLERMLTSGTSEHTSSAGATYMQQCATEYVRSAGRTVSHVAEALVRQIEQLGATSSSMAAARQQTARTASPLATQHRQDQLMALAETLQHGTLQLAATTLPAAVPLLCSSVLRELALSADLMVAVSHVVKFVREFSVDLKPPHEQAFVETPSRQKNFVALIHACRAVMLVLEAMMQGGDYTTPHLLDVACVHLFPALCELATHESGELRMFAVSCIRRCFGELSAFVVEDTSSSNSSVTPHAFLHPLLLSVERLLQDATPTPQYTTHLLVQMTQSKALNQVLVQFLMSNPRLLSVLVSRFVSSVRPSGTESSEKDGLLLELLGHFLEAKNVLSVGLLREGLPACVVLALRHAVASRDVEAARVLLQMMLAIVSLGSAMKKDSSAALALAMAPAELVELCASFVDTIPFLLAATGGLKSWSQRTDQGAGDFEAIEDAASKCIIFLTELYPFTTIRQILTAASSGDWDDTSPRARVVAILADDGLSPAVRHRILRILLVAVDLATSDSALSDEVGDAIVSPALFATLSHAASSSDPGIAEIATGVLAHFRAQR